MVTIGKKYLQNLQLQRGLLPLFLSWALYRVNLPSDCFIQQKEESAWWQVGVGREEAGVAESAHNYTAVGFKEPVEVCWWARCGCRL